MARKQLRRDWPGDPHAAWREAGNATTTCQTHSLPRPALPDWRDFDVFTRQVSLPPATPSPSGTVGVGLFDEILVVRGQQGRLYLDEPRHDEIGARIPHS